MDRNDIIEECALKLEALAEAAENTWRHADTKEKRERYATREEALLDGAASLRNLKASNRTST